jgi:hypothetical protein
MRQRTGSSRKICFTKTSRNEAGETIRNDRWSGPMAGGLAVHGDRTYHITHSRSVSPIHLGSYITSYFFGQGSLIALMMEAVRTSETSVNIYLTTRQYIPYLPPWEPEISRVRNSWESLWAEAEILNPVGTSCCCGWDSWLLFFLYSHLHRRVRLFACGTFLWRGMEVTTHSLRIYLAPL